MNRIEKLLLTFMLLASIGMVTYGVQNASLGSGESASYTGDKTITGDLSVTGNATIGGGATVTGAFEVVDGSGVVVGTGGVRDIIDGVGDLLVTDEFNVKGVSVFDGTARFDGAMRLAGTKFNLDDTLPINFNGAENTYIKCPDSVTLDFVATGSTGLSINANSAVIKSSTTAGLQGTTPDEVGEIYFNTDTNEIWIATGTTINGFVAR